MTTILDKFNALQTILPIHQNSVILFDIYSKQIRTPKYIEIVKQFLLLFNKDNYRDFFSLIIISNYPDIVADDPIFKDKNIIELCKTFFNELNKYSEYSECSSQTSLCIASCDSSLDVLVLPPPHVVEPLRQNRVST